MRESNNRLYVLAQGAMICSHLCGAYHPVCAHQLWSGPVQDCRGPLHPALLHAGGSAGTVCGVPAFQPALRGHAPGRGIRKPGNADRGSRFMVCEEAQMVCVRPAHPCQYRHHPWVLRYAYGSEDLSLWPWERLGSVRYWPSVSLEMYC